MSRDSFSDGPVAPDPAKALQGALEHIRKLEKELSDLKATPPPRDLRECLEELLAAYIDEIGGEHMIAKEGPAARAREALARQEARVLVDKKEKQDEKETND